jgi:hypothetical protein
MNDYSRMNPRTLKGEDRHSREHSLATSILMASLLAACFLGACSIKSVLGQINNVTDNFGSQRSLDPSHWLTGTPLLSAMAQAENSALVAPQLSFDESGMRMAGVNGMYQFTGVQSRHSFSLPFTLRVNVMGAVANGNAFGVYIVSDDLRQGFKLEGNVNPRGYRGLWIAHAKTSGENVFRQADLNQWYTLSVALDAQGIGTMSITDSQGAVIATRTGWSTGGRGPFYIVLGQREGAPLTVGPNVAVWSSAEVLSGNRSQTPVAASTPGPVLNANTENSGIRSVDFQNREYSSSCLGETGDTQIVHISNGKANTPDADFRVDKPVFGDLKGDGQEEAVVVLSCHPSGMSPNEVSSEIFVFEMSARGPKILAKFPPSNWGGRRVERATLSGKYVVVSYLDGECNACTDSIVSVRFQWNGARFVRIGQTREPYKPS